MAGTTGPIVAAGALTWANRSLFGDDSEFDLDFTARVVVGTAVAAAMFYGLEKITDDGAVALAYLVLVGVIFVPVAGSTETPATRVANLFD